MIARTTIVMIAGLALSCSEEAGPLASYAGGGRPLSTIVIQDSVFTPEVTWVGGYVSIFGVNKGTHAILDSSLAWLVYSGGNSLKYPVTIGQLPAGAQDLTLTFGGVPINNLTEDQTYTFWIMSGELWSQVSTQTNKYLVVDSLGSPPIRLSNDTLYLHPDGFSPRTDTIDIFVNIRDVLPGGRLGTVSLAQSSTGLPIVNFAITQTSDTAVAAMGLVIGRSNYSVNNVVWEVLSDDGAGNYGTLNVIEPPLTIGAQISGTQAFTPFPEAGLIRNRLYYVWIATKDWDGISRTRTANYYAWATFETW